MNKHLIGAFAALFVNAAAWAQGAMPLMELT